MASLDSLPADQRAVLALVLQQRRSYDEIARLLSIDRGAVRERALTGLDLLGPQIGVPDQRRALIADYLLGQLPPRVAEQTRARLAESPSERAWARVLASELAPLSGVPLPDIPVDAARSLSPPSGDHEPELSPRQESETGSPASSRRGGLALILAAVVAVIVVVIALVTSGGGSNKKRQASATAPKTAASTTATTSSAAHVVAQITLTPTKARSKTAGIAEVLKEGSNDGIAIVAQNVAPNTTKPPNAYAVWLYNSPTDAHILGFVNPGVSSSGRLSTAGGLPANASHYKDLIVTVETRANPTTPGAIILQGPLTGL